MKASTKNTYEWLLRCLRVDIFLFYKIFILSLVWFVSPVFAVDEIEPNNTCETAQNLTQSTILQVNAYKAPLDIDYYKVSAPAGTSLRVTMGANPKDSLPLVAVQFALFTDCNTAYPQSQTSGYNAASLDITVPASGYFIVAATGMYDTYFTGEGGEGGYILSITPPLSTSISGRVIDSNTHAPLSGTGFPNVTVSLQVCRLQQCFDIGGIGTFAAANVDGTFSLQGDFISGDYRIIIYADSYSYEIPVYTQNGPLGYESIHIETGTNYNFGDISLSPVLPVKSIRGRVIDNLTKRPLSGLTDLATVDIYRDGMWLGKYPLDSKGNYNITLSNDTTPPRPLIKGNYFFWAGASQYSPDANSVVGAYINPGEEHVFSDLTLTSFPIRVSKVKPCNNIPSQGGDCKYSYTVTLGNNLPLKGDNWNIVNTYTSTFQICEESISLAPEKGKNTKDISCKFTVPGGSDYTFISPSVFIGEKLGSNSYFKIRGGYPSLFSVTKQAGANTFKILSQYETEELKRRIHNSQMH